MIQNSFFKKIKHPSFPLKSKPKDFCRVQKVFCNFQLIFLSADFAILVKMRCCQTNYQDFYQ